MEIRVENTNFGKSRIPNFVFRNFLLKSIFCFFILFILFDCSYIDENRIDSWDITKRIQPLIEAKALECGVRPSVPLFFTGSRPPGEVEACERDILTLRCPFRAYPWSCVRIF